MKGNSSYFTVILIKIYPPNASSFLDSKNEKLNFLLWIEFDWKLLILVNYVFFMWLLKLRQLSLQVRYSGIRYIWFM